MRQIIVAALVALPLAGCLTPDRQDRNAGTRFRINPDRTWTYETDTYTDGDLKGAPVGREDWLRSWLADNSLCPNGYQIVDVQGVRAGVSLVGPLYRATYTGRCR